MSRTLALGLTAVAALAGVAYAATAPRATSTQPVTGPEGSEIATFALG